MTWPLIRLLEIPEPSRPCSSFTVVVRNQRPIFSLDDGPQLGCHPRRADWVGIPGIRGFLTQALTRGLAGLGKFSSPLLEDALAITCHRSFHLFNQSG